MSPESKNRPTLCEKKRLKERLPHLRRRAEMLHVIRGFFIKQGYLEVDTPYLIPSPAPETHIEPIRAGQFFLQSSPELCMKRLLASGYAKIFQISKTFRAGERGDIHLPEFTLLEWYKTGADYEALMNQCKALILRISQGLEMGKKLPYQGQQIDLRDPWERISVKEAFDRYASIPLDQALEKACFDQVMVEEIEQRLGRERPSFLYDYPASLAAMARLSAKNAGVAERFELYIGGMELANGFSELTDPVEQRLRFERERQARLRQGKEIYPMPEKFLERLKDMPEAAGIAMGVDRLTMVFTDSPKLDDVVAFTPEEL